MIIDIVTIFPEMFWPVLGESIIKRACNKGLVKINVCDLRKYSDDPHQKVDDASYGGGGMVFRPAPVFAAVEDLLGVKEYTKGCAGKNTRVVLLSPAGEILTQSSVRKFLNCERLVLLAPRYEGVDQRVREFLADEELSVGDYVLSGGELPAMVLVDCVVRLIPGVVSDADSVKRESFENGKLDFPHYTRPEDFRGMKVPKVLLSGNHADIEKWRLSKALEETRNRRPDLLRDRP